MIFFKKKGIDLINWGDYPDMHIRIGLNKENNKFYVQLTDRTKGPEPPSFRTYLTDNEFINVMRNSLAMLRFERNWTKEDLQKLLVETDKGWEEWKGAADAKYEK